MAVETVGLDLAKDVFRVRGISETGRRIFSKKINGANLLMVFEAPPRCVVGMEACGSAQHWGRLRKLGHDLRLMPAACVKAQVKRGRTDAADAEAICEAVRRPTMRLVELKTEDQQALLTIRRTRDPVVRQRTQVVNMIRSPLREFGHVLPSGVEAVPAFAKRHLEGERPDMPELANGILGRLCHQLPGINERIHGLQQVARAARLARCERTPAHGRPRHRPDHCAGARRHHRRRPSVRDRQGSRGLARADAAEQIERRQGEARTDHEEGRSLHPKAPGRRHDVARIDGETASGARGHPEREHLAEKPFRLATIAMANKTAGVIWAMPTKRQESRQPVA